MPVKALISAYAVAPCITTDVVTSNGGPSPKGLPLASRRHCAVTKRSMPICLSSGDGLAKVPIGLKRERRVASRIEGGRVEHNERDARRGTQRAGQQRAQDRRSICSLKKGSVESTHKVPTSHTTRNTATQRFCSLRKGQLNRHIRYIAKGSVESVQFIHTHQHAHMITPKQDIHTSHTSRSLHSHARDVQRIPRSQTRFRVATPGVNPGSVEPVQPPRPGMKDEGAPGGASGRVVERNRYCS